MEISALWDLRKLTTRGNAVRVMVFFAPSRPGFRVQDLKEAHCPPGQPARETRARFRLDSPNSSASLSRFLAKPR